MIIDADGHTHIPQEVFDQYLDKEFHRHRPRFITALTAHNHPVQ